MLTFDSVLLKRISDAFALREPNRKALEVLVCALAKGDEPGEYVADLATGVGKTFLMAALVEYASEQGVRDVLIVTPGRVVQAKTVENFRPGSPKYISGSQEPPVVLTPETYKAQGSELDGDQRTRVFIFNIQQLLSAREGVNLGTRKYQEVFGGSLYERLQNVSSLLVIADEHHLYHSKARAFSAALRELNAKNIVGLTATPDPSDRDKIVVEYTLGEAIADGFVKRPVIVYRPSGTSSERLQLLDAIDVLRAKEKAYAREAERRGRITHPVVFVVASSIQHAEDVAGMLSGNDFLGSTDAVLVVTSESSQDDLEALDAVETPSSPVRAIVSVNKLREGWDVSNIAVLVALRKLASQALTEQVMGRGLRLPFGSRTGDAMIDSLDIVAHDSYRSLLAQKDLLAARTLRDRPVDVDRDVDRQGYAPVPDEVLVAAAAEDPDDIGEDNWDVAEGLANPSEESNRVVREGMDIAVVGGDGSIVVDAATVEKRLATVEANVEPVEYAPNWKFSFPLPRIARQTSPFELVSIPAQVLDLAGQRHRASAEADELKRTELTSRREDDHMVIGTKDEENLQVSHKDVADRDEVVLKLRSAVIDAAPELPRSQPTLTRVEKMVDRYLQSAGSPENWTRPWLERARQGIVSVIRAQMAEYKKSISWAVELERIEVPARSDLVFGDEKRAHEGVAPVRNEPIAGWYKHSLPIARFDAVSTEWAIALILDKSPNIEHWLRLSPQDGVSVQGGSGYVRYFPDFVALDVDGIYWLIEGKSDTLANSLSVQDKKASANEWARRASDSELFSQEWRYMFVTESVLKASGDTWPGLKASAEIGGD